MSKVSTVKSFFLMFLAAGFRTVAVWAQPPMFVARTTGTSSRMARSRTMTALRG